MTIHLPPDLENSIRDAVHSGHFASVDDAMTEAASMLVQRLKHEQAATPGRTTPRKPILERLFERAAAIPDEECDKLPDDLAEQHDHYLYRTSKRPTA
jgi:Arc/MetJ-type ribon-helix-helix transcriptional regulator